LYEKLSKNLLRWFVRMQNPIEFQLIRYEVPQPSPHYCTALKKTQSCTLSSWLRQFTFISTIVTKQKYPLCWTNGLSSSRIMSTLYNKTHEPEKLLCCQIFFSNKMAIITNGMNKSTNFIKGHTLKNWPLQRNWHF